MRPFVVSGSAHPALGEELARELECELASCLLRTFPDGERDVEMQTSVRGQPVFVTSRRVDVHDAVNADQKSDRVSNPRWHMHRAPRVATLER